MKGFYRVRTLLWGYFGLDGGAMFGVVPKTLWERTNPADERNRIELALRGLLIEGEGVRALVDCGTGGKMGEKLKDIYKIREAEGGAAGVLGAVGLRPEDVTHVFITHLHFDHAGGSTIREGEEIRPTFPKARYFVQRRHLEWAREPSVRDRASFFREDFEPLAEKGLLVALEGSCEVLPGIFVEATDGHTPGLQVVRVRTRKGFVVYPSDIIPTSSHIPAPYVMGYDLQPLVTVREKTEVLERAAREGDVVVFEHDPKVAGCCIVQGERGPTVGETFGDPLVIE